MDIAHNTGYFYGIFPPTHAPPEETRSKRIHFHVPVILSATRIILFMLGSGLCVAMATRDGCSRCAECLSKQPKTMYTVKCFVCWALSSFLATDTENCESEGKLQWEGARLVSYCYNVFSNVVSFANLVNQVYVTSAYSSAVSARL